MKLKYEKDVMSKVLENDNKEVAMILFNYHAKMKNFKNGMKEMLDLLDEISEGSEKAKQKFRTKILDTYNDLPRESLDLIDELNEKI